MEKILKRYKNRLVNINSNNRSLYLRKLDQKQSFDLSQTNQFYPEQVEKMYQQLLKREAGKMQLFPDMIEFRHRFEQRFNRQIQQEQNQALADLNQQQASLGVDAYTKKWEAIEQEAGTKRETAKRELANAIQIIEKQQKKLAILHRECVAAAKETGRYELKIGYPFIKGKFLDGTLVNAPLFLFTVRLERGVNNTWFLDITAQPPTINRVFLLAVQKYNQTPIALDVIEKFAVDKVDFSSEHLYRQLLRQFSLHIDWQDLPLTSFPEPALLDEQLKAMLSGSFQIEHHFVLGNFPIANSLYYDYEQLQALPHVPKMIEHLFTPLNVNQSVTAPLPIEQQYFLTSLDESQEQAIALTQQQPYTVIYGPPGTGKSQTIANIIGQSLAKNKRVLVVSHKKAALDVIYNRLPQLQAQSLLLHQPASQAEVFFQKVTKTLEQERNVKQLPLIHDKIKQYNLQLEHILSSFEEVKRFIFERHENGLSLQEMYAQSTPIQMRRDARYDFMRFWQVSQQPVTLTFDESTALQGKIQQHNLVGKAYQAQQMKTNPYVSLFARLDAREQAKLEQNFQQTLNYFNGLRHEERQPLVDPRWNLNYWQESVHVSHTLSEFQQQLAVQVQTLSANYSQFYEQLIHLETLIPHSFWMNFAGALEKGKYDQLHIYFQQIDEALELLASYEQLTLEFQQLEKSEIAFLDQCLAIFETAPKVEAFVQRLPELVILQSIRQAEAQTQALATMEQFNHLQKQAEHVLALKLEAVSQYLQLNHDQAVNHYWKTQPQQMEALYHQVTKQRQTTTIRESIHHHYQAYFTLFPCWLASPETIADIFPFTANLFDIVIFDEASQLAAEQTIPVFYRGKQIVVVGDDQQLKPPQLFTLKYDDDVNAGEQDVSYQVESILDLAKLKYPSVKLNYHYRSQASELIAFSNAAFYANELMVTTDVMQMNQSQQPAIQRFKVAGIWNEQTNLAEAYQIVALIAEVFVSKAPSESVGVITFNSKQKDLILDLLEQYANENPDFAKAYFIEQQRYQNGEDISFFVKNIENVQGDERDIILFSTAYAPNKHGKMNMNFGTLSQDGGENRLNVAITRARKQIILVTSIEPEALEVEQTKYAGAKMLKAYLAYVRAVANRNSIEVAKVLRQLQTQNQQPQKIEQSIFAQQLAINLELRGFEVKQNLGTKMYHYDLAIYDSSTHTYLLGLECDPQKDYPKTAKHRDVIKQHVLSQFGWQTMRVWSRDWWLNPEKVLQSIEQRLEELKIGSEVDESITE